MLHCMHCTHCMHLYHHQTYFFDFFPQLMCCWSRMMPAMHYLSGALHYLSGAHVRVHDLNIWHLTRRGPPISKPRPQIGPNLFHNCPLSGSCPCLYLSANIANRPHHFFGLDWDCCLSIAICVFLLVRLGSVFCSQLLLLHLQLSTSHISTSTQYVV